jgi:hypothetical protein
MITDMHAADIAAALFYLYAQQRLKCQPPPVRDQPIMMTHPLRQLLLLLALCAAMLLPAADAFRPVRCRCSASGSCSRTSNNSEFTGPGCTCPACPKVTNGVAVCTTSSSCDVQCNAGFKRVSTVSGYACRRPPATTVSKLHCTPSAVRLTCTLLPCLLLAYNSAWRDVSPSYDIGFV